MKEMIHKLKYWLLQWLLKDQELLKKLYVKQICELSLYAEFDNLYIDDSFKYDIKNIWKHSGEIVQRGPILYKFKVWLSEQ